MKVMTARVVDGKIDTGDAQLEEGASVAVLISEGSGFHLTDGEHEELEAALAEIRRGEYVDGRELTHKIAKNSRAKARGTTLPRAFRPGNRIATRSSRPRRRPLQNRGGAR